MAAYPSQDQRPLKKARLGPPDVYPQEAKQKEDELTSTSVKLGFTNHPHFNDEYGSAKSASISQEKFGAFFSAVMTKKIEQNTWSDSSKKKPQITKENFWPVTTQKRPNMESWFKDLASGTKPLGQLSRKVPSFNKKEEIFTNLCEFNVPMIKAAWFVKMTAAYYLNMQENKPKKRQTVDQSLDWTLVLNKYQREQLGRVQEYYHGNTSTMSFLTATQPPSQIDLDQALKQWHYSCKLARHMYDEGLLDRHEFLTWVIDNVEKSKQADETVLKLILKELLQYLDEICLSAQLSRRLTYIASRRIGQLCNDSGCASPRTQSPMLNNSTNTQPGQQIMSQNPLLSIFAEFTNCPQHRGIVLSLSACIQVVTLNCPSALIWNNLNEGRVNSPYCGSPLDYLPCCPSSLPMPHGETNQQMRSQLRGMEHQIRLRSRAAEVRWSSDKCQQSTTGFTMSKVLNVLDILDRHNFEKVESNNCLESLYSKILAHQQHKDGSEPLVSDEPIITLLIDWAVSVKRHGAHRAVVVAKLLEKRQHDIRCEKFGDGEVGDDKDSAGSDMMIPPSVPVFQSLLLNFLDTKAPTLDNENRREDSQQGFANLIHLFSELIRHDVFSHDAYMCTLISRGELLSAPPSIHITDSSVDLASMKSEVESIKHEHQDDIKVDMDIQSMETDFPSFFSSVGDEPRLSPPAPASVKSIKSEKEQPQQSTSKVEPQPISEQKGPSRHMQYASHFPLPTDENHECNQRQVVLFGFGKARDQARHNLKKVGKEILRLYSKKNCIDVSSGDLGKQKKKKDKDEPPSVSVAANLEVLFDKFHKLTYYDQHVVTSQCTTAVLDLFSSYTGMNAAAFLPQVENISYLFDLMEHSMDVNNLLEFSVKLLKELSIVETLLSQSGSSLTGIYTTSLCLCIVAIFRKYHAFLLVSEDLTFQAFEGLIGVVKHVCNPADCCSSERCILAYLYDVYTSCSYLKNKFQAMFSHAYSTIQVTLYGDIKPSASNLMWDPSFMNDFLASAKSIPIEQQLIDQLNKQAASRYSFVVNTMLNICNVHHLTCDRLNEMSVLCAELTAKCYSLSAEWLGVLKAMCCSSNHNCGYIDLLTQIDVSDLSFHDHLAVFTSILIARHCFSLQDLLFYVALPSLVNPAFAGGDQDAEPGARLTCHLLLRLFKVSPLVSWPGPSSSSNKRGMHVKASCDRHLLAARHNGIDVGAVLAVLKAMLGLADSCRDEVKTKSSKKDKADDIFSIIKNLGDDDMMDVLGGPGGLENAGLSEFAKHSLREMCSQNWVREKFLRNPEGLFTPDMLLDNMLSAEQTQQLVRMICYPAVSASQLEEEDLDNREMIENILDNLDPWTLRVSLLELTLMFKQAKNNAETNSILDNISQGTIYLFHQQTEQSSRTTNNSQAAALLDKMPVHSPKGSDNSEKETSVWLVAPLISKLPSGVQGRVLRQAGQVLENSNTFLPPKSKQDKERNQRSKSLLSHQPFLSLILTCLKGQDEQREGLLNSLLTQLEKFITSFREMLEKYPDEAKIRNDIHETLQLRLSLVGGMFDTIQRNIGLTTDWSLLLIQLISSGVVDIHSNYELFTTVLDMLNCLVLGTLVPDPNEKSDDNRKVHGNLVKKLRRELGDKTFEATDYVRQLLPLPKRYYEVVTVEPHGTLVDTKGNKIQGFDSIKRKQGLQVGKLEMVNPWDVIESSKNPPPLSWTFFGGVRIEKKPLKYDDQHRLSLYHGHWLQKPISYYIDPPVLPPEELEPPPEKPVEEKPVREPVKAQSSLDSKQSSKSNRRNNRRNNRTNAPTPAYQQPTAGIQRSYSNYSEPMYQQNPNWYGPPQNQPQAAYMPQPPMPQGPRFGTPGFPPTTPKQALQTMLRTKPNTGGYMQQPNMTNVQMMQKQLVRQRLVALQQQQRDSQANMYNSNVPGPNPNSAMMSQGGGGMNPGYQAAGYGGMQSQGPIDQMGPSSMYGSQSYTGGGNQSYQAGNQPPSAAMMSSLQQPQQPGGGYISQPSQNSQIPPYSSANRMGIQQTGGMNPANNMPMGASAPGGAPGSYNQMAAASTSASYMQGRIGPTAAQQQQRLQQYRQQQLLAMQKQQQQQQQQAGNPQTAALLAQLRQPQQPMPPTGYNQFQQNY